MMKVVENVLCCSDLRVCINLKHVLLSWVSLVLGVISDPVLLTTIGDYQWSMLRINSCFSAGVKNFFFLNFSLHFLSFSFNSFYCALRASQLSALSQL